MPSVRFVQQDGNDQNMRRDVWSIADIFALPVDNIQETFGIAPLEAMAAGLPLIVTDWDGFRDTVTPETGFRIATRMDPKSGGPYPYTVAFYQNFTSYQKYLSLTSHRTSYCVSDMAKAISTLVLDQNLRKKMGRQASGMSPRTLTGVTSSLSTRLFGET